MKANPYARRILAICTFGALLIFLVFYSPTLQAFRIPMACTLPLCMAYGIGLAIALFRAGPGPVSLWPLIAGVALVVCGASFDGAATLINSPTLSNESNAIARSLLDSGFPLSLIVLYGVVLQAEVLLFICILWAAFMRHKNTVLALARGANPRTAPEFIKAAMGGGNLSWRAYLFTLRPNVGANYYNVWVLATGLVFVSLYRLYVGLEWFGLWYVPRSVMLVISSVLPVIGYVVWLWFEYSKNSPRHAATDDSASIQAPNPLTPNVGSQKLK